MDTKFTNRSNLHQVVARASRPWDVRGCEKIVAPASSRQGRSARTYRPARRRRCDFLAGKDFSSRNLRALRGFAVNPGLDFHREGAKHEENAKDFSLVAALLLYVHLRLSVVETDLPAPPFQGSLQIGTLNPGLAPWAVLLDPFGVRCFATETRSTWWPQSSQNGQISSERHG